MRALNFRLVFAGSGNRAVMMESIYDVKRLKHIGQGCVYFYTGDDPGHLTSHTRRQAAFGTRVLPVLVIGPDCRMYADCPHYSPIEWIPKMVSVSPPAHYGFSHRDVYGALGEIASANDQIKEGIACDLVTIARVAGDDSVAGRPAVPMLRRLADRVTRYARDKSTSRPERLFHAGRPVPCHYFDEAVMIVTLRYDGDIIPFETYKEWEAREARAGAPDEERLPLWFHAPLAALELFLGERGIRRFDIVNLETLRI